MSGSKSGHLFFPSLSRVIGGGGFMIPSPSYLYGAHPEALTLAATPRDAGTRRARTHHRPQHTALVVHKLNPANHLGTSPSLPHALTTLTNATSILPTSRANKGGKRELPGQKLLVDPRDETTLALDPKLKKTPPSLPHLASCHRTSSLAKLVSPHNPRLGHPLETPDVIAVFATFVFWDFVLRGLFFDRVTLCGTVRVGGGGDYNVL